MSEADNTNNWDDFRDRFDIELFKDKGIAQLGRRYIKNNYFIHHLIPFDESDEITPLPIAAKGITAFLASDDYMFREAVRGEGRNAGKGVQGFYQSYYGNCLKHLKYNEKCRAIFESDRKSDYELIHEHLKSEIRNFKESELLFTEFHDFGENSEGSEYKELERSFIDIVKRAAKEYPKWVRKTHSKKSNPDDDAESEAPPSIDDILKDMFPFNANELPDLKKKLEGGRKIISLTFVGTKVLLWRKLKKLRLAGIKRKIIANVFAECVKLRKSSSIYTTSLTLIEDEIYKNI
ncbi:MAG: hypothetical protein WCK18_15845 [Prolixibacteraceae bacterium]